MISYYGLRQTSFNSTHTKYFLSARQYYSSTAATNEEYDRVPALKEFTVCRERQIQKSINTEKFYKGVGVGLGVMEATGEAT